MSEVAVSRLIAAHRELLAFVERRVGDRAMAEDILQAAFVRGLEKADSLRDDEQALAWFYRILRNAVVDHYRHRAAEGRALQGLAAETDDETLPEVETREALCACFTALLPELKPEYRQILEAVDLGGREPSEAADALGLTANNARVRLHRARQALRAALERSCRTCAEHGCLDCSCGAAHGGDRAV